MALQLGLQIPRVQAHAHDRRVPAAELGGLEDVAGFGDAVFRPGGLVGVVVEVGHVNAPLWSQEFGAGGGDPDHADGVGGGAGGGGREDGGEEFGEEVGGDVVGAELQFVALFGLGALRGSHHAGVVPEDVEAGVVAQEGFR